MTFWTPFWRFGGDFPRGKSPLGGGYPPSEGRFLEKTDLTGPDFGKSGVVRFSGGPRKIPGGPDFSGRVQIFWTGPDFFWTGPIFQKSGVRRIFPKSEEVVGFFEIFEKYLGTGRILSDFQKTTFLRFFGGTPPKRGLFLLAGRQKSYLGISRFFRKKRVRRQGDR